MYMQKIILEDENISSMEPVVRVPFLVDAVDLISIPSFLDYCVFE
mgnify:CR=1 FL=1